MVIDSSGASGWALRSAAVQARRLCYVTVLFLQAAQNIVGDHTALTVGDNDEGFAAALQPLR